VTPPSYEFFLYLFRNNTDGIQYQVLQAGSGRKPVDTDTVECYFRTTHLDGAEVVASEPGHPATFQVKEASVPGWAQVLPLMPVGAQWRVYLPSQYAYGEKGVGWDITPNEAAISDLELVAIK